MYAILALGGMVFGQAVRPAGAAVNPEILASLRSGIGLFAEARYTEALPLFDALFMNSEAGALRAEGAYWSAMAHIALRNYAAAEAMIDLFLEAFPDHQRLEELLYQQGRVYYLQQKYEQALQILNAYMVLYPESEVFSSVLFWIAESLYELGRLTDAERLYQTISENYSDSVKAEAARYRLDLIRFKYRETELLTLLRWSHEESLKVIEEFQRREKSYEQALQQYQRQIASLQQGDASGQTALTDQIARLEDQLAQLQQQLVARELELAAANAARQTIALTSTEVEPGSDAQGIAAATYANLLAMKERSLNLLVAYLEIMQTQQPAEGGDQ